MQPLLSIQSVPISLEWSTTRATLQIQRPQPNVNVSRNKGRSEIRTDPVRVKMDSYESRASMGLKTARRSIEEYGSTSKDAGYEGVRNIVENGNTMLDSLGKGNPIVDIAASRAVPNYTTSIAYIPSVGPQFSVEGGNISFDYTMDQLTFDWHAPNRPQANYIPGELNFTVAQYPEVIIEYIGDPIYVPPSADPNYVPVPPLSLDATA